MTDRTSEAAQDRMARLERENAKLRKINDALIDRIERGLDHQGNAYSLFQTAVSLEAKVRDRTLALLNALENLETAKAAAETARRFLVEAIDSISEGFALYDAEDRLVLTNNRYQAMFADVLDHLRPGDAFTAWLERLVGLGLVADAVDDPGGWVTRRLTSHQAPSGPFVFRMSSGTWLQASERRTRDGGCVSLYTDITQVKLGEQRRRELELAEKSILLQSTLDNLAQGVCVFDRSDRLALWNHRFAELLALSPERLRPGIAKDALPVPQSPVVCVMWTEQVTAAGLILEVRCSPMPGGNTVVTFTDITQQRCSDQQLREAKDGLERRVEERTRELSAANLAKTRFLAAASHDLMQPLSAARVFVSVLAERKLSPHNRGLARSALSAMDSLDEILASLLDLSKLETGRQPVNIGEVDLTALFAHLADEYSLVAERKGLTLRFMAPTARLRSDPHLLGRILRNFLSNAVRYTETGGRILVGARRAGTGLLVGVWDTGIGVPPDKIEEIFEEFHRLEAGKSHHKRGVGLGLSIVRSIGRMLNHPLVVRSRFGHGSLFGIEVPLTDGTAPPSIVSAPPVVPSAIARLDGARIVVIDNDPDIRSSLESLLRHWCCLPLVTSSGEAALSALADQPQPPDLIIADWHLDNGAVGLDAITALRHRFTAAIPAVVITADDTDEIRDRVEQAGCHLLNKPLRHGKLRSLLAHLLRERKGEPRHTQ